MDTIYATVIDAEGFRVEFVLMDGDIPMHYELNPGEYLVYDDWQTANEMAAPRWTGTGWEETGTPEPLQPLPETPPDPWHLRIEQCEQAITELYALHTGQLLSADLQTGSAVSKIFAQSLDSGAITIEDLPQQRRGDAE